MTVAPIIRKFFQFSSLLSFLMHTSTAAICQSHKIDSLKITIQTAASPALRLQSILQLCLEKNSLRGDTLYVYALQAKRIAQQLKDKGAEAWADYNILAHLLSTGRADSMLVQIDRFAGNSTLLTDRNLYYKVYLLKANALNRNNKLNEALELQLKLFAQAEAEHNTEAELFLQNYLGATSLNLKHVNEARTWWQNALELIGNKNNEKNNYIEATILGNLGLLNYNNYLLTADKAIADSGIAFLNQSIDKSQKGEYLGALASGLVLKGNFLAATGKLKDAETMLTDGIAVRNRVGDPYYIMQDLISLSAYYTNARQYGKAIAAVKEALALADANNLNAERLQLTGQLAANYKLLNSYELYSKTLEQYIALADADSRTNSTKQLAEIQTKYELQKKETQIAAQQISLLRRKYLLVGSLLVFMISILAGYLAFKNYRYHQKINTDLLIQEEKKQRQLAVQYAEEKERTRIAADLHDNIGVQASAILYGTELLKETKTGEHIVDNLHDTAKEMLLNLRETLWAMKNTNVPSGDLWIRVINFTKQMGRHYAQIKFSITGTCPENFILDSARALNFLMIIQEAVNNAARHAAASVIQVKSSVVGSKWICEVIDNGRGFNAETATQNTDANGLKNMQQRALQSNAVIYFATVVNEKGSSVTLSIPIQ